jgi:DNA-binding IclR family transcriptional regulator
MKNTKTKVGHRASEVDASRPGIQVIARAANILRALEDEPAGLSLGEIARKVSLPRSTVQRIVAALADEQLVIAATPTSRVKLGPTLVRLATSANVDIGQIITPSIQQLSRELRETVDASILKGDSAVFIDQALGSHRLRAVSAIGESFPLHCTANGKALLATLSPDELDQVLSRPLKEFTDKTITDPEKIAKEVRRARRSCLAFDIEEHTEGICAIGTFFLDPLGRAFALSIPVPTARFKRVRKELEAQLLSCRERVIASLREAAQP